MSRLWLLDFDGTLVNSEKAIKACYLKVGQELVPDRCCFIKNMVIGPTLDESSRIILTDKNLHLLDIFKNRFQQLYDNKLVLETPQYPNVDETLKQLLAQGDDLYIVTNKRSNPTHKLIYFYNWQDFFERVACMDDCPSAQSKSDLINLLKINIRQYDDIYFVGDTLSDGLTAKSLKIPFIFAKYGYGVNQDWNNVPIYKTIKQFDEILSI